MNAIQHRHRTKALVALAVMTLVQTAQPVSAQECCAPSSNNLVAWWPLDESQGTTAQEETGQHAGTWIGGPSPITGKVQGALHFDGIDDYVSVPDSSDWTFPGDFTIELWARWDVPVDSINSTDALVAHDDGGGNLEKWIFMVAKDPLGATGPGPYLTFHYNSSQVASGNWLFTPFDPQAGLWYHVAITRQGDLHSFFVDGKLLDQAVDPLMTPNAAAPLTLGQAEGGNFFNGSLDEVSIYHRALSIAEIQAIVAVGPGGKCSLGSGVLCPVYCTAGVSASGCQASILAAGQPSAYGSSGFFLLASEVEGAKDGMFFYGANGRQAVTWGTGFQCVVPPVKRAGLLAAATGSTVGACDGTFDQDLNALWCPTCPKPLHNPGAGAVVQAQFWYRDPWNTSTTKTTTMSDAIEFTVGP